MQVASDSAHYTSIVLVLSAVSWASLGALLGSAPPKTYVPGKRSPGVAGLCQPPPVERPISEFRSSFLKYVTSVSCGAKQVKTVSERRLQHPGNTFVRRSAAHLSPGLRGQSLLVRRPPLVGAPRESLSRHVVRRRQASHMPCKGKCAESTQLRPDAPGRACNGS